MQINFIKRILVLQSRLYKENTFDKVDCISTKYYGFNMSFSQSFVAFLGLSQDLLSFIIMHNAQNDGNRAHPFNRF